LRSEISPENVYHSILVLHLMNDKDVFRFMHDAHDISFILV